MAGAGGLTPDELAAAAAAHIQQGPHVVALSGGADSAVCAWVVRRTGRPLRLLHVHHGLRWSDRQEAAARRVADWLNGELEVLKVSVPDGPSPEGQARSARYDALFGELGPGEWLATGHTADDQAETVLLRALRGTGIAGLAGMAGAAFPLTRPLLFQRRGEVRQVASRLGIPFADDPANAEEAPARNRVRHRVLPALEAEFNPDLRGSLARLAELAARDEAILADRAGRLPVRRHEGAVLLPAGPLVVLPVAIASRAIRAAVRDLLGAYPDEAAVVAALEVAAGGPSRATTGMRVEREGAYLVMSANVEPPSSATLAIPGSTVFGSHHLSARVEDRAPLAWPLGKACRVVDAAGAGHRLSIRAVRPDDRIDIGTGSKRVLDALAEARVPRRRRATWPVAERDGRLAWVPGVRSAAWLWPTAGTRRFAWLCWEED